MELEQYIKTAKYLIDEHLPENIVVTIIQEVGKDNRTNLMETGKAIRKDTPKDNMPSEKQIALLKKFKVKDIEKLSREEATAIISEKLENKENKDY